MTDSAQPDAASRFRLAIFDFDGTLADSWPWFLEQLGEAAERFGIRRVAPEEIDELRRLSSHEILQSLRVPLWKLPGIASHFRKVALAQADRIRLFPGIADMLRTLHARGLHLAIASSNDEQVVRSVLGAGLADLIGRFECGASMFGKATRITRLLKALGLTSDQAVLIGDETRDADAAQEAGVAAAAVLWGYGDADAFTGAALVARFRHPEEIVAFLAGSPIDP